MSAEAAFTYDAWLRPTQHEPTGIVDGDTLYCGIDLGCNVAINEDIRLYGVNAPEIRTDAGKAAKQWVIAWFGQHCPDSRFVIATQLDKTEKFGRLLGDVYAPDGAHLNADLVASGNAVSYFPKLPPAPAKSLLEMEFPPPYGQEVDE
jgi:endonuclease YncB( thermonuclease family)